MSNLILPALPGFDVAIRRKPMHSTAIQAAVSGRELRASWYSYPRYVYTLPLEFLRSKATVPEYQNFANFLTRHAGQFDSFLFTDPEDNAVTTHGFGVGNGSTVAFQLQRTLGVTIQDALGTWQQATAPRTNVLQYSQQFDQGVWNKTQGGVGAVPVVTANGDIAPDGTATADLVSLRLKGGTTSTDLSRLSQDFTTQVGQSYVASVWLRTADGSTKQVVVEPGSGTVATSVTVTGAWQRFSAPWTAFSTFGSMNISLRGNQVPACSDSADLMVWGAQYEVGAIATQYIATTSAAVTATPNFWPKSGDGYEPIFDPAPGFNLFLTDWQGTRQLLEFSRTNLILQSEVFDNASWTKSLATVTANAQAAPDGTTTGDKIVETATTGQHQAQQTFAGADNSTVVISCWLKAAERTQGYLFFNDKAGGFPGCMFNLSTGVVSQQNSGAFGTITAYPNGWYRCSCSASLKSGGSTPSAQVLVVGPASALSYAGDGTSGLYTWGYQLEVLPTATPASAVPPAPYIKTTTVAITVTDYTIGANGLITLAVAPLLNASLSWTGSFYRRVRVNSDAIESTRIVPNYWEAKSVELISDKP